MAKKEKASMVKKPFYKKWWFILIVVLVAVSYLGNLMGGGSKSEANDETEQSSKASSKKAKSSSIKSSSKLASERKSATESRSIASSKKAEKEANKYVAVNSALVASLEQDKGWAQGKLDSNGKPTTSGTPNAGYDWSLYVDMIEMNQNDAVYVYVTKSFGTLNEESRNKVALTSQNSAVATLLEKKLIDDSQAVDGIMTWVKYGDTSLGRSKMTNVKEFKWNN